MPTPPPKFFAISIIVLGIIVLIFSFLFVFMSAPPKLPETTTNPSALTNSSPAISKPTISIADPSLGPTTASITIVEFADYRCTHCSLANLELKKALESNPGKIRLVWKDFPFLPPLDITLQAHEAARCAEKQKKFWEYHDTLFANQDNLSRDQFLNIAKSLDLDLTIFQNCLDSEETKPLVTRGLEEGKNLGVDGTPYFFINDQKFTGEITADTLTAMIK